MGGAEAGEMWTKRGKNGQYLVLGNTFFDTKILTGIFYRLG